MINNLFYFFILFLLNNCFTAILIERARPETKEIPANIKNYSVLFSNHKVKVLYEGKEMCFEQDTPDYIIRINISFDYKKGYYKCNENETSFLKGDEMKDKSIIVIDESAFFLSTENSVIRFEYNGYTKPNNPLIDISKVFLTESNIEEEKQFIYFMGTSKNGN